MTSERLLREYIRVLLREDDGGVYGDLAMANADNPWGVSFGTGHELADIFIKPFTDVFKVAAGKAKETSQKAQTVARVAFETVMTTIIPVLTDSYNEIFKREKERIDQIREQYADVYRATWDAFRDNDVMLTAFCYDPVGFITNRLVAKSPKLAIGLLSVLSGGTLDPWLDKVKQEYDLNHERGEPQANKPIHKTWGDFNMGIGFGGGVGMEGLVREANERPGIEELLTNPKVLDRAAQGDVARKTQKDGRAAVRSALTQVYKQAKAVLSSRSVSDLQQKLGKPLKGTEKLAQLPPQERAQLEQRLLAATKQSMRAFYVKNLSEHVKKALNAGVPKTSKYVTDYEQVIQKIKAL